MKTYNIMTIVVCLTTAFGFSSLKEQLTKAEREFAIKYLKDTKNELVKLVKPLSDAQLNFKPSDSSWSVANCVEHIALSKNFIFQWSQDALVESAEPGELSKSDEALINVFTDRSVKVKTLQPLEPSDTFIDGSEILKEFVKDRDHHIDYLKTTKDPLRSSYFDFPFGKGDAYQVILFVGAHSKRHILQIQEIMSHPEFPE